MAVAAAATAGGGGRGGARRQWRRRRRRRPRRVSTATRRVSDDDVRRPGSTSGLRVVTESLPGLALGDDRRVGRERRARRDRRAVGREPLPRAPAVQGHRGRSAREIAEAVESVGGEMNAFTTHEQTVFYVGVPDTQLELAIDILADVLWQPGVPARRRRVGAAGDPRRDRDARRHARRSRARPVRRGALPRAPARPRGARQPRRRSRRCRATTSPRITTRTTSRPTSCSPRPATSTTTTCSRLIARAVPRRRRRSPGARARPTSDRRSRSPSSTRPTEQAHVVLGLRVAAVARPRPRTRSR